MFVYISIFVKQIIKITKIEKKDKKTYNKN